MTSANVGITQPTIKSVLQGLAIFVGTQFLMNQFLGNKSGGTTTSGSGATGTVATGPANTGAIPPYNARPSSLDEGAVYNPIPQRVAPIWPTDSPLDLVITVSPSFVAEPLSKIPKERVIAKEENFGLSNYSENRVIDAEFDLPKDVQNNGTLWGHFYIGLKGSKLDPAAPGYDPSRTYHFAYPLTQYIAQKKIVKTKNLLAAANETAEVRSNCFDI